MVHLAGRGHLDSEDGVGAHEPREGEHGRLDAHVVEVQQRDLRRNQNGNSAGSRFSSYG